MTPHLTEEQLYALLDQPGAAAANLHLQTCPLCRNELLQFQATFADLRTSLTALASELPARPLHIERRPKPVRTPMWAPILTLATCAVFTVAAIVPSLHHRTPAPAPVTAAQPINQQEDEALLEGIDHDLSTPFAPSLSPLSLEAHAQRPDTGKP